MLNKKQAAEYLNVSTRTLERHVKRGKANYNSSRNAELIDPGGLL